jgi:hypothetical protein
MTVEVPMRFYSFGFVVAALAVAVTFVALQDQSRPEPSVAEMKSSFSRFLSKLEMKSISEAKFRAFEKHSCTWSGQLSGHICRFTYSTDLAADQLSVLPAHGTISGTFFLDHDGRVMFETVIG